MPEVEMAHRESQAPQDPTSVGHGSVYRLRHHRLRLAGLHHGIRLGQAVTWLVITFFVFLIPFGLLTAEVSTAFPAEGGVYAWCRMAFGKLFGELATMMYWLSNAIWLGGTLTAVTIGVINVFFTPKHPLGTAASIVVGLVFTWVTIVLSVINLKYGKWTGNLGTFFKAIIMVLMAVLGLLFLVRHGIPKGIAPASSYTPSITGFLAVIGVIVFLWVGFELQGSAAKRWSTRRRTCRARFSAPAPSRPPCTSLSCSACSSC